MWERIPDVQPQDANMKLESHRLKVPGGWVVRTITSRYEAGASSSQTFVADAGHEWDCLVSE